MKDFKKIRYYDFLEYWDNYKGIKSVRSPHKTRRARLIHIFEVNAELVTLSLTDTEEKRKLVMQNVRAIEYQIFIATLSQFPKEYPKNKGDALPAQLFSFWHNKIRYIFSNVENIQVYAETIVHLLESGKSKIALDLLELSNKVDLINNQEIVQNYVQKILREQVTETSELKADIKLVQALTLAALLEKTEEDYVKLSRPFMTKLAKKAITTLKSNENSDFELYVFNFFESLGYKLEVGRVQSPRFFESIDLAPEKELEDSDLELEVTSEPEVPNTGAGAGGDAPKGLSIKIPPPLGFSSRSRLLRKLSTQENTPSSNSPDTNYLNRDPKPKPKPKKHKGGFKRPPEAMGPKNKKARRLPVDDAKKNGSKEDDRKKLKEKGKRSEAVKAPAAETQITSFFTTDLSPYYGQEFVLLYRGENFLRLWEDGDNPASEVGKADYIENKKSSCLDLTPLKSPAVASGIDDASLSDWYMAERKSTRCEREGKLYPTRAHVWHTIFSNSYNTFTTLQKPLVCVGLNPWVCFAESDADHALRYGFGQKWAADVKEMRLRPQYNRVGKPENKYVGMLSVSIATRANFAGVAHMSVLPEYAAKNLHIDDRIVHERETSFLSWSPSLIYKEVLTWPDFSKAWQKQFEIDFGLNKKVWSAFKSGFGNTTPHTMKRKYLKNALAKMLIVHRKKMIKVGVTQKLKLQAASEKYRVSYTTWVDKLPPVGFFKLTRHLLDCETIHESFNASLISESWLKVLFYANQSGVMDFATHVLKLHPTLAVTDPGFLGRVDKKLKSLVAVKLTKPGVWDSWSGWQKTGMTRRAYTLFHQNKAAIVALFESDDCEEQLRASRIKTLREFVWMLKHPVQPFLLQEEAELLLKLSEYVDTINDIIQSRQNSTGSLNNKTASVTFKIKDVKETTEELEDIPPALSSDMALTPVENPSALKMYFLTIAKAGNVLVVTNFLSKYADRVTREKFLISTKDTEGNTAFHYLAKTYSLELYKALWPYSHRTKIHTGYINVAGQLPLHFAAQYGQLGMVKKILTGIANPNKCDGRGYQALHYACMGGHVDVAKELVFKKFAHLTTPVKLGEGEIRYADSLVPETYKVKFKWLKRLVSFQIKLETFIQRYETYASLTEGAAAKLNDVIKTIVRLKGILSDRSFEHVRELSNRVSSQRAKIKHYTICYILCREKQTKHIHTLLGMGFNFSDTYPTRYVTSSEKTTKKIAHAFSPFALSVALGDGDSIKRMVEAEPAHLQFAGILLASYGTPSQLALQKNHKEVAEYLMAQEAMAIA